MDQIKLAEVRSYHDLVGKYVSFSCKLEHTCHVFIIEHFVDYKDILTEQFVEYFLSKPEITFSTILNTFYDLIISDAKYESLLNPEVINKKNVKAIIKYRNILAHASFNGITDGKFEFLWLNKEYKKGNYVFKLDPIELQNTYQTLIRFANKVTEIASPIIEREMKRHGY